MLVMFKLVTTLRALCSLDNLWSYCWLGHPARRERD